MGLRQKWRFRLIRSFFGLTSEYMENVYNEFFLLKYHGGWSFIEAYNLPVSLRSWFLQRLQRQFDDEAESYEKAKNSNS